MWLALKPARPAMQGGDDPLQQNTLPSLRDVA
jgi:hypothetical protein